MYVGLYDEPMNSCFPGYKGLFRSNGLIDFCNHKSPFIRNNIDWFFSESFEGMYVAYTKENLLRMQTLHNMLRSEGWYGDLLYFGDTMLSVPPKYVFLGYDVCADSKYYSPIGDGFLESYSPDKVFFSEMGPEKYKGYANALNVSGLFSSYETAKHFSHYCNSVNKSYAHAVETENDWRPFAIYCIK